MGRSSQNLLDSHESATHQAEQTSLMPTKLRIQMRLEGSGIPEPEHLRAFGASIFERGLPGDHNGPGKAHSVGPLANPETDLWHLDLAVVDDRLVEVARSRLGRGTPVFLGPLRGEITDNVAVTAQRSWDDLCISLPLSVARFSFEAPVHFRSSQRRITEPEPLLIFRHLRDRWRQWAPDSAPSIDFRAVVWSLRLDGTEVTATGPGRYDPRKGSRVANRIPVWAGEATVTIDEAASADRCALGALVQAAPFFGVGANTTAGFGATSVTLVALDG